MSAISRPASLTFGSEPALEGATSWWNAATTSLCWATTARARDTAAHPLHGDAAQRGRLEIMGLNARREGRRLRARIGYLSTGRACIWLWTAAENSRLLRPARRGSGARA